MGSWDCHTELRPSAKLGLPGLPEIYLSAHARLLEYRYRGTEITQLSRLQDLQSYPRWQPLDGIVTLRTRPEGSQKSALDSFQAEEMAYHSGLNGFEEHASGEGCSSPTDGVGRSLRGVGVVLKDPACLAIPSQAPAMSPCSFQKSSKKAVLVGKDRIP